MSPGAHWPHCSHRVLLVEGVAGSGRLRLQPQEWRDSEVASQAGLPKTLPTHLGIEETGLAAQSETARALPRNAGNWGPEIP